jgi:hypothetical protein
MVATHTTSAYKFQRVQMLRVRGEFLHETGRHAVHPQAERVADPACGDGCDQSLFRTHAGRDGEGDRQRQNATKPTTTPAIASCANRLRE